MAKKKTAEKEKSRLEEIAKEAETRESAINDYLTHVGLRYSDGYKTALDAIGGKPSALNDENNHDKFLDALVNYFVDKFKEEHGEKFEKGDYKDLNKREIFRFMTGATREQFEHIVKDKKGEYTLDVHEQLRNNHLEQLKKAHEPYILEHIREEDKDQILEAVDFKGPKEAINLIKLRELYANKRLRVNAKEKAEEAALYGRRAA